MILHCIAISRKKSNIVQWLFSSRVCRELFLGLYLSELLFAFVAFNINLPNWQLQPLLSRAVRKLLGFMISLDYSSLHVRKSFLALHVKWNSFTNLMTLWPCRESIITFQSIGPTGHAWSSGSNRSWLALQHDVLNENFGHSYIVADHVSPLFNLWLGLNLEHVNSIHSAHLGQWP